MAPKSFWSKVGDFAREIGDAIATDNAVSRGFRLIDDRDLDGAIDLLLEPAQAGHARAQFGMALVASLQDDDEQSAI